jgi:hypothetical protein
MTMTKIKLFPLVLAALLGAAAAFLFPPPKFAQAADARTLIFSETYDAASTADGAGITNVIAAPGAVLGDACLASVAVDVVDMTFSCSIQAAGLAEVRMQNESGSTADLASTTWRVFVFPKGTR